VSVYGERIAKLEERVDELSTRLGRVENKLDQLLELKNKGAGAFWLVSLIFGTGIIGGFATLVHWWRN
jgi:hypothetical protein